MDCNASIIFDLHNWLDSNEKWSVLEEISKVFGIFCQFDVYSFCSNNNTLVVLKLPPACVGQLIALFSLTLYCVEVILFRVCSELLLTLTGRKGGDSNN